MAIEYEWKMRDRCLSKEILYKKFDELGIQIAESKDLEKGIALTKFDKEIGFKSYLLDADQYPYNIWDSQMINNEFEFAQVLIFRFIKENDNLEYTYKIMLDLLFSIIEEFQVPSIFLGNGENEYAYFSEENKMYLDNSSGIWERSYFKEVIKNRSMNIMPTH
ncbi:hypothetical protein ACYSNR_18130 [Enterococcus sp. LJL128]